MRFVESQLRKHRFNPAHKNETMKQLQERLEKAKSIYDSGGVQEMLESPFMFKVDNYGVDIQYSFCTCPDFVSKLRICKHVNAAFIHFAVSHGMSELPSDANEFHEVVLNYLKKYQESYIFKNIPNDKASDGRPQKVAKSTRKIGRPRQDKRISSFVSNSHDVAEVDRIVGVSKDIMGRIFYKVVWSDGSGEKWVNALEID